MKVTIASMVMCGADIPTVYAVYHTTVKRDRRGQRYVDLNHYTTKHAGNITREGRLTAADYYEMAKQYATPEYPAFCFDYKPGQ